MPEQDLEPIMSTHKTAQTLPYACEQLFDLAADVESYPEYLPGWNHARILASNANHLRVEQQLGLKPLTHAFVTTAELDRPRKISIHSEDAPFRFLQIEWRFEPADPGHCTVSLEFSYRMRNGLLEQATEVLFAQASSEIIQRFSQRARQLYGGR